MLADSGTKCLAVAAVLIGGVIMSPSQVQADVGFKFDYRGLGFAYNPYCADGPGGAIGSMSVTALSNTSLQLDKFSLGGDGFGGAADSLVDSTGIASGNNMNVVFTGDVYQTATGYRIVGTLSGTDTDQSTFSHQGNLDTMSMDVTYIENASANGGVLSFTGTITSVEPPNDSILINRPAGGDNWVFEGDGGETVELGSGRGLFDVGAVTQFSFGVEQVNGLDSLFGMAREGDGGSLVMLIAGNPVPAPSAMLLGMIGLGLVGWTKRLLA
ncbi:MAG: hypothetical protein JXQ73_14510 [Phycisphaerae bacterium]|nr:hypothetical protein [Phycisphaerae bacterium]